MEQVSYKESGIDERILRAVGEMGFEQMTPIQAQAIPVMMEGRDVIGQAQTGTGKTAAFGIPLLQKVDPENKHLQVMVLCPTRELAIQAALELRNLAKFMHGIKVLPIYGGQDINKQIRSLKDAVQVVVGTPGRVMDHMRRHTLKLDHVELMILDEADEMLNMGFREDIETILAQVPKEHQMALFSATMPPAILEITKKYQKNAVRIKVAQKELTVPLVKQYYYEVRSQNKVEVVCRLLDYYDPKRSLIFCNTKRMVDELTDNLKGRGYFAEGLHGDLSQHQRDQVMGSFRNGKTEILIATDVAARGIDVDDVEAVFNYDVPQDIEYYVHRIGRTGRAGRTGRSFTLVVGKEIYKVRDIERVCKTKIKAKAVPSAADITAIKAEKIFHQAMELMKDEETDMAAVIRMVEQKLDEEDCTAIELAAAFLRMQMGEEPEEIPTVKYFEQKYGRGKNDKGRGRKDKVRGSYYRERDTRVRGGLRGRTHRKAIRSRNEETKAPSFSAREKGYSKHYEKKTIDRDRYTQPERHDGSFGRFSEVEGRKK